MMATPFMLSRRSHRFRIWKGLCSGKDEISISFPALGNKD